MKHLLYALISLAILSGTALAQPLPALKKWLATSPDQRAALGTLPTAHAALTRQQADEVTTLLLADQRAQRTATLTKIWSDKAVSDSEHIMKFEYRLFGEKPKDGRSLFISMHGGGNTKPEVNDQQWKNQIGLYKPAEGIYVAPAPQPTPGTSGMKNTSTQCLTN